MKTLLDKIEDELSRMGMDSVDYKAACRRIKYYFVPGMEDILDGKSWKSVEFVGAGMFNIVVRIGKKLFRIAYYYPDPSYVRGMKFEFEILHKYDFGILPPLRMKFEPGKFIWHEIQEAKPYQGATVEEISALLHKVIKLAEYNMMWADYHDGNIMTTVDGRVVITDFDLTHVDVYVEKNVSKFKDIKLKDIQDRLDKEYMDWRPLNELKYMIFAFLKIEITNENWMKYIFGEVIFRKKYTIPSYMYPTSLWKEMLRWKGAIPF